MKPVLSVIGRPGSGKSTLTDRLCREIGWTRISTGELFRSEIAADTAMGKRLRDKLAAGRLAESTDLLVLLFEAIGKAPGPGIILDGAPRKTDEALGIHLAAVSHGIQMIGAILLDVSEISARDRLALRNSGRPEDSEGAVDQRMRIFNAECSGVCRVFEQRSSLKFIAGTRDSESAFSVALSIFEQLTTQKTVVNMPKRAMA